MFCKNCGKENAGDAKFCVSCGFDFAQSTPPAAVASNNATATTKPKRGAKLPIILACVVVVALFALYQLGANAAKPEKVVEKYIAAFAVADYTTVYDSLELTSDTFTTQEIFTAAHSVSVDMSHNKVTSIAITPAAAKDIESIELLPGSWVDAAYQVTYTTVVNPQPFTETVLLTKSGKLFGLFDRYKIEPSQLVAQYYTITAPAGITVCLDGIQLDNSLISDTQTQTSQSDSENPVAKNVYTIQSTFVGAHTITAKADFIEEYIAPVFVMSDSKEQIAGLAIKAEVRTQMRTLSEETLGLLFRAMAENKSFDDISPQLGLVPERTEAVKKYYGILQSTNWSGFDSRTVTYTSRSITSIADEKETDSALTSRPLSPLTCHLRYTVTCDVAPKAGYILAGNRHTEKQFNMNIDFSFENGELKVYDVRF